MRLPEAIATQADASPPVQAAQPQYRHRLVHYVEDNETNVEVMRGVLAQRPQITLLSSTLGLDGLATIRAQRPSLVLLDMQLPDVDGMQVLEQLKRDPATASIPCSHWSGRASTCTSRPSAGVKRNRPWR